jgi:hypothetical protein
MDAIRLPRTWDLAGLRRAGFEGFLTFSQLRLSPPPTMPGVYVVLRLSDKPPTFLLRSLARGKNGVDPSYAISELQQRWVDGAAVVYVGKADGRRGISGRLAQYGRRGTSHQGGRAIWQLEDADALLVTWQAIPDGSPEEVEIALRIAFKSRYGKVPFANIAQRVIEQVS